MIKHVVTLKKTTNGNEASYFLGKAAITPDGYLNILRNAKSTAVKVNEPNRVRSRVVGTVLVLQVEGVPQEVLDVYSTSAVETEEPTEAQPIAQDEE